MKDEFHEWVAQSPYALALGIVLEEATESSAQFVLPYRDENSNPGQALHGGCAASLGAIGGQVLARAALGTDSGPWHTAQLQVNYLSAAIAEDVVARAKLLRRGKELCFVEVDIETKAGKSIARTLATVRGRFGAQTDSIPKSSGDHGQSEPGPMGPHIGQVPFIGNRGITVEHMNQGTSRLTMPWQESNEDREGGIHEGAVLALLDTTGAMAAWAESGPGPYRASTPSLQLQNISAAKREGLVAYGRCVQRDQEIFWTDVEVASQETGEVRARGNVLYRILT